MTLRWSFVSLGSLLLLVCACGKNIELGRDPRNGMRHVGGSLGLPNPSGSLVVVPTS